MQTGIVAVGLIGLYSLLLMRLASGTRLGPYEILAPLGSGGMGEVYRAIDKRLERTVAIKILPKDMSANLVRKQRGALHLSTSRSHLDIHRRANLPLRLALQRHLGEHSI